MAITKKQIIALACFSLLLSITLCCVAEEKMHNPLIWSDVPDTAMIRVDDTYYMSSTTMHLSPGLPIMQSKDLVNWTIASYAYQTLTDNDEISLRNGKNAYGSGSWASSLRYHKGTFYVTTFSYTSGKTHVYSSKNPQSSAWAEKNFTPALHDASLFFDDDGKVYMLHGGHDIRLTELTDEIDGIKPGGFDQIIIPEASNIAGDKVGLRAEGAQVCKINGKYYVFLITWPQESMRTALVFRSDQLTGPYTGQVALRYNGIAQGGLIDTPNGDWYAIMFQDAGAVGRIPCIMPVTWVDDWPVLGIDGKVPETLALPAKSEIPGIVGSDDFTSDKLGLQWQWNHNPDQTKWSLTDRPGFLRLITSQITQELPQAVNTLTQRTFGPACYATTSIDVSKMKSGDIAGLSVFQKRYGYVGVKAAAAGKSIVLVQVDDVDSGLPVEKVSIPLKQDIVSFKIEIDYWQRRDQARFFYSLNGKKWEKLGENLHLIYTLPHFMGYRFALFNFATEQSGGYADFDNFIIGASAK